jgi:thioredoxin 1
MVCRAACGAGRAGNKRNKEIEMSALVQDVNDANFESEVLNAGQPVLVDFWAAWCAPCRMLAPTVEAVAEKFQGKAKVVKLNVDENVESSSRYGIKGIPTLILFNGGKEADRVVGVPANAKDFIAQMIDRQLG